MNRPFVNASKSMRRLEKVRPPTADRSPVITYRCRQRGSTAAGNESGGAPRSGGSSSTVGGQVIIDRQIWGVRCRSGLTRKPSDAFQVSSSPSDPDWAVHTVSVNRSSHTVTGTGIAPAGGSRHDRRPWYGDEPPHRPDKIPSTDERYRLWQHAGAFGIKGLWRAGNRKAADSVGSRSRRTRGGRRLRRSNDVRRFGGGPRRRRRDRRAVKTGYRRRGSSKIAGSRRSKPSSLSPRRLHVDYMSKADRRERRSIIAAEPRHRLETGRYRRPLRNSTEGVTDEVR